MPYIRAFADNDFRVELLKHPQRDKYWENVEMIQTAIKSKNGQGKMILCNFEANMQSDDPNQTIEYGLDSFESDLDLLRTGNDHRYCLKKCHEMGEYL